MKKIVIYAGGGFYRLGGKENIQTKQVDESEVDNYLGANWFLDPKLVEGLPSDGKQADKKRSGSPRTRKAKDSNE